MKPLKLLRAAGVVALGALALAALTGLLLLAGSALLWVEKHHRQEAGLVSLALLALIAAYAAGEWALEVYGRLRRGRGIEEPAEGEGVRP